jgi:hypothetical protein
MSLGLFETRLPKTRCSWFVIGIPHLETHQIPNVSKLQGVVPPQEPLSSSGRTDFEVALASNILFKGSVEPSALKDQVVAAVIAIAPRRPALEKRYGTM